MIVRICTVLAVIAGYFLTYVFWPESGSLPKIKKVEAFSLEAIQSSEYDSANNKVKLVNFFYTSCPDVCPLTMTDLKKVQDRLKDENLFGSEAEIVSISFDPENDTEERVREYANHFHADFKGWKFLSGRETDIKRVTENFNMNIRMDNGSVVAHSTKMYLVDQNHYIRAEYDMAGLKESISVEEILADIKSLAR
jgi:protein SCO1